MRAVSYILGSALALASVVSSTSILLPLYEWPTDNTTWSPVFEAATAHPHINFKVIVNPNTGPGDTEYPDSSYIESVAQLNTYSNVDVLGYVHTSWASRSISDVESDVSTYSGWASYTKKNITVSGIFFDEAPHTNDATDITYMQDASDAARSANLNTVVFNPGCKLDSGSASKYFAAADLIVEFENSYSAWTEAIPADEFSGTEDYSQDAVLLYSAPLEANYSEVIHEARQMGLGAAYLTETSDYTNADSVSKVAVALMQAGVALEAEGETSSSTEATSTKTTSVTSSATETSSAAETTFAAQTTFAAETTSSTETSSATVTKTSTVISTSTVTATFTVTATSTVATPSTVIAEAVTVTEVVTVTACPRRGWSA